MIADEFIKTLANKYQTTELNIRREYLQHLFLSYFYQQPQSDKIYFKGGTALRFLYQSPRFSEDLDFSSSLKDKKALEQIIINALAEIEREGIQANIQEAKTTTGGYLAIITFKAGGYIIKLQMEISLRQGKKQGEVTTIASDFVLPYTIVHLNQAQLIDEKIKALFSRKKPRDFYDFYFIIRANLLAAPQRNVLIETLKILKKSDIRFAQELKQFLPKNHWSVICNFPAALEREIKRFL
jgi:predicted nucleotidyltransferase component of viral defense system